MKLKKLKKSKHMLTKIQILKLSYKNVFFDLKTAPKSTEVLLNKIANIIYTYHVVGHQILFLGFPKNFSNALLNTKHILIPEFAWFDGMLNNNIAPRNRKNEKTKIPKDFSKLTLKLKEKAKLIIIYDFTEDDSIIKESYFAQIPVITISKKFDIFNNKYFYSSTGSYNFFFERTENTFFFFSFIKTVLTKAKHVKSVYKNNSAASLLKGGTILPPKSPKRKHSGICSNKDSFIGISPFLYFSNYKSSE